MESIYLFSFLPLMAPDYKPAFIAYSSLCSRALPVLRAKLASIRTELTATITIRGFIVITPT